MKVLVEAVKAHARAHYNEDGWDNIVECYDDAELQELLEEQNPAPTTPEEAIKVVHEIVKLWHGREKDIQAERF